MAENTDQDIHDRHAAESDTDNGEQAKAKTKSKTTQAVRDAHFEEDGVKADGTVPKAKGASS